MMEQLIYSGLDSLSNLNSEIKRLGIRKPLFIHGNSFNSLTIKDEIKIDTDYKEFTSFSPNPDISEVREGIRVFKDNNCDAIFVVGGGSAIDVGKAIKHFGGFDVSILAVPTTAGSGSEATRFAVIYENHVKQSINGIELVPDIVFIDSRVLKTLPSYQRKSTLMDALCQSIEALWSVNSCEESNKYANESIELIMANYKGYIFEDDSKTYDLILKASFLSGKAINITQTTAAHACAYKITTNYGFSHGHAVSSCLSYIWEYMTKNMDKCIDSRGKNHVRFVFENISKKLGADSTSEAISIFRNIMEEMGLEKPSTTNIEDYKELVSSVNVTRLKNNPIELNEEGLMEIYKSVVVLKRG